MKTMVPNYYKDFKCVASKCTDTCCAGWKIIIDDKTYARYNKVCGEFGKRLKNLISIKQSDKYDTMLKYLNMYKDLNTINDNWPKIIEHAINCFYKKDDITFYQKQYDAFNEYYKNKTYTNLFYCPLFLMIPFL